MLKWLASLSKNPLYIVEIYVKNACLHCEAVPVRSLDYNVAFVKSEPEQIVMQESKEISWVSDHDADAPDDVQDSGRQADVKSNGSSESDGWQQYRKWISKAPVPRQRRGGIDPSLYTWKGYRNWTEQVKRNWSEE